MQKKRKGVGGGGVGVGVEAKLFPSQPLLVREMFTCQLNAKFSINFLHTKGKRDSF